MPASTAFFFTVGTALAGALAVGEAGGGVVGEGDGFTFAIGTAGAGGVTGFATTGCVLPTGGTADALSADRGRPGWG